MKPSNSPVTGSRKLSGLLFWSMPTITRPRRRIASTLGPGPVDGRKLAVASQLSTAAPDTDGTTSAPLGIGSVVSEADTSVSGCTLVQLATSNDASTRAAAMVRISGTHSVVARYRRPPPAPPAH